MMNKEDIPNDEIIVEMVMVRRKESTSNVTKRVQLGKLRNPDINSCRDSVQGYTAFVRRTLRRSISGTKLVVVDTNATMAKQTTCQHDPTMHRTLINDDKQFFFYIKLNEREISSIVVHDQLRGHIPSIEMTKCCCFCFCDIALLLLQCKKIV